MMEADVEEEAGRPGRRDSFTNTCPELHHRRRYQSTKTTSRSPSVTKKLHQGGPPGGPQLKPLELINLDVIHLSPDEAVH